MVIQVVNLYEQMLDCLSQVKIIASEILSVSRLHLEALKKNKSDNLRIIVGKQETLIGKLTKTQKNCNEKKLEIGRIIGAPEEEPLSALILQAPEDLKNVLTSTVEDLKVMFAEIQDINDINKMLTQNALAFNELLISMFAPSQSHVYKGDGVVDKRQTSSSRLNLTV